jgi:hypothetical protein
MAGRQSPGFKISRQATGIKYRLPEINGTRKTSTKQASPSHYPATLGRLDGVDCYGCNSIRLSIVEQG